MKNFQLIAAVVSTSLAWCLPTTSLHSQSPAESSGASSANEPLSENDAETWTRFRGPEGRGVVSTSPVAWPWDIDRATRISLPGTGIGSPVVWGDTAYLMSSFSDDASRYVIAVDWQRGSIEWQHSYASVPHRLHSFSSYASTTPAVDETGVVIAWGDPLRVLVKKFTHSGEEIWSRDLGRYVSQHGFGTSPILVDGLVILLNSQDAEELERGVQPGEDRMIALNAETGSTVWERALPTRRVCYGVPAVRRVDGATELVCATTGQGIFGMDLKTGDIRWSHDCFRLRVCASMVLEDGLAIASHGSMGGRDNLLVAFDMQEGAERFRITRAAPYVPTPLAYRGNLYLWSDAGIVSCISLEDGRQLWSERIGGNFFSSPVILGDAIVNVSDIGEITAIAASENFKNLGTIKLDAKVRSTLAVTSSSLLLRAEDALWVIHP
jgi:outer membrane protein assembly factor BamB